MVMCSNCHKRVAVIFVTKLENGEKTSQGLCIKCAKDMGVYADSDEVMTNLDWLYEHDREKLLDIASKNIGCRTIFDCPDLVNGECTNKNPSIYSACYKRLREWLMAPHEDANDDSTPKSDVSAASVDANDRTVTTMPLHVPSETIVNGERVRGISKIGWSEQTAEADNYTAAEVGNGAQTTREAAWQRRHG